VSCYRIWKFPLEWTGRQAISVPKGANPLSLQVQAGQPVLWARVDSEAREHPVEISMYGTGWETPAEVGRFLGTLQDNDGLVFHFFANWPTGPQ
jgi:hypothetical protein